MRTTGKSNWRLGFVSAVFSLTIGVIALPIHFASAGGPQCTAPYVQVQDAAPATNDPSNTHAIQRINFGEPFVTCSQKKLTVVMKVPTMDPGNTGSAHPPPDGVWRTFFKIPATTNSFNAEETLFVEYNTTLYQTPTPGGQPVDFGFIDPATGGTCAQCSLSLAPAACKAQGTVTADGTITITMDFSSTVTFGSCDSAGPSMTISPAQWATNPLLYDIQGVTQTVLQPLLTGGISNLTYITNAQTVGDGQYQVQGNVSCSNPPVAALAATPTSGPAPLTVNFNASASNVPAGGCGTINQYIFDYGDGQTETKSVATASHTYTQGGATYPARVRVKTTSGVISSNIAQQDIVVSNAGPPPVVNIVSRKTHGSAGDFDIILPQPPNARAIECRSGGSNSDYKLVFTFLNNLTSVGGATVTGGAGSANGNFIGPSANQYTVNLTGVTSGQTTTVTLNNVVDSTGATGVAMPFVFGVLVGDTTNDATVNSADIAQTKSKSGQAVDATNFRQDVTGDGNINSADIALTKSKSGTALP